MNCCCLILNYNGYEETAQLIKIIADYNFSNILVVDNCSTDNSFYELQKHATKKISIIRTFKNGGYGSGNNFGMRYAFEVLKADLVLICNPDVVYEDGLISRLKSLFKENKKIGVVSALQKDKNQREVTISAWKIPNTWDYIFSVGGILKKCIPTFYYSLDFLHHTSTVQVDCVAGSLLMISKDAFKVTGGYDEDIFLYCEETTLGCKMRDAGYETYLCSDCTYTHLQGVSISKSIKSILQQKKIMLNSHHVLLRKYLKANHFQVLVDKIISNIVLCEEAMKSFLKQLKIK
jgi:GT2 family glycosyltransferase